MHDTLGVARFRSPSANGEQLNYQLLQSSQACPELSHRSHPAISPFGGTRKMPCLRHWPPPNFKVHTSHSCSIYMVFAYRWLPTDHQHRSKSSHSSLRPLSRLPHQKKVEAPKIVDSLGSGGAGSCKPNRRPLREHGSRASPNSAIEVSVEKNVHDIVKAFIDAASCAHPSAEAGGR